MPRVSRRLAPVLALRQQAELPEALFLRPAWPQNSLSVRPGTIPWRRCISLSAVRRMLSLFRCRGCCERGAAVSL